MNNKLTRALLLAFAVWLTLWAGCAGMLDPQLAKDRDLGKAVEINLRTDARFRDIIVSFKYLEPAKYECVTRGLTDPHDAGTFAYNIMIVLNERNDTKVHTGRSRFDIVGIQDGDVIFEVTFGSGMMGPAVILMGPFEGEEYVPNI